MSRLSTHTRASTISWENINSPSVWAVGMLNIENTIATEKKSTGQEFGVNVIKSEKIQATV